MYNKDWSTVRRFVLDMQGNTCMICSSPSRLEVHHIDRDKSNDSYHNLIALCKSCHRRYEGDGELCERLLRRLSLVSNYF